MHGPTIESGDEVVAGPPLRNSRASPRNSHLLIRPRRVQLIKTGIVSSIDE